MRCIGLGQGPGQEALHPGLCLVPRGGSDTPEFLGDAHVRPATPHRFQGKFIGPPGRDLLHSPSGLQPTDLALRTRIIAPFCPTARCLFRAILHAVLEDF